MFFYQIAIHLSLGLHLGHPSPKREYLALQYLKCLPFFLFFRVIVALLDPDPADQNQYGSGYETLNLSHE
jgi:hypothetical protein